MGQLIPSAKELLRIPIVQFDMTSAWDALDMMFVVIDKMAVSSGWFRDMHHLKCVSGGLRNKKFVMKVLKLDAVNGLKELINEDKETNIRKTAQMHMMENISLNRSDDFGDNIQCCKIFFSTYHDCPVTIEPYLEGRFEKYINNNGDILQ